MGVKTFGVVGAGVVVLALGIGRMTWGEVGAAGQAPAAAGMMDVESAKLADLLHGKLEIFVEGSPGKAVVSDGTFVSRQRIADKEFLVVSEGNDRVLIRTQTIVAIRVKKP